MILNKLNAIYSFTHPAAHRHVCAKAKKLVKNIIYNNKECKQVLKLKFKVVMQIATMIQTYYFGHIFY